VHFLQSRRIAIDDPDDFARLFVMEISDEVRPPLPAPITATRIIAMRAATALACRAGRRVRPESRALLLATVV